MKVLIYFKHIAETLPADNVAGIRTKLLTEAVSAVVCRGQGKVLNEKPADIIHAVSVVPMLAPMISVNTIAIVISSCQFVFSCAKICNNTHFFIKRVVTIRLHFLFTRISSLLYLGIEG